MAAQTQMSSFAKKLGSQLTQANSEHANKPVDTGRMRLPPGIKNGIAKLESMVTKEQDRDDAKTPKGQTYFQASAVVISPEKHGNEKIKGKHTFLTIPLCDIPAKGMRKEKKFSENWFEFQNLFKLLSNGAIVCHETQPERIEAFYFAAMKALTDPNRPPVYIKFSTRGWAPPKPVGWKEGDPEPEVVIFETWEGTTEWDETYDPSAGVTEATPYDAPPTSNTMGVDGLAINSQGMASMTANTDQASTTLEEEVENLVNILMEDSGGNTEEGVEAAGRLEQLAIDAGWTKEQVESAEGWDEVGTMALNGPEEAQNERPTVTVGSKWKFCRRTKEGHKIKNNKGEEFPPQEVEVVSVNLLNETCGLKTTRDGKVITDLRTKQPVEVKWEWLE